MTATRAVGRGGCGTDLSVPPTHRPTVADEITDESVSQQHEPVNLGRSCA